MTDDREPPLDDVTRRVPPAVGENPAQQYPPPPSGENPAARYAPPPSGENPGARYAPPPGLNQQYPPPPAPPYAVPPGQQAYGPPQYGAPQYGTPQQSAPQYGAPQYGGPPPPYGPPQWQGQQQYGFPPPQVDASRLRPPLWWIAVAWTVAVVCAAVGVALFAGGVTSTVAGLGPSRTFAAGETVTVSVDPADGPAIYLTSPQLVHFQCTSPGGPAKATLTAPTGKETVTTDGKVWELIAHIHAPTAGEYRFACTVEEQSGVTFGIGSGVGAAASGLLGSVAILIILPTVGFLLAVIVTVLVLVRRSSHRKRLLASPMR
jgi:hypothetical protein